MGKTDSLEQESSRRTKRKNLQDLIVDSVFAAGILSAAIVAPNILGAIKKLGLNPSPRQTESIKLSQRRLIKKGLLHFEGGHLSLTPAGKIYAEKIRMGRALEQGRAGKWDKKWRILIFDIPESRKGLRQKVRSSLVEVGFVRLQDSVWVYPFNCEEYVAMLKADLKIGKSLLYIIADQIENDAHIRKMFDIEPA